MSYTKNVYQVISNAIYVRQNSLSIYENYWEDRVDSIMRDLAPSGSGFDHGTLLNLTDSTPEKLVFSTSFHHLNKAGFYTSWTEHSIIVKPSLLHELNLRITGKNENGIKEYIEDCFTDFLTTETTL